MARLGSRVIVTARTTLEVPRQTRIFGPSNTNPGMLQEPRPFLGLPSGIDGWREHCTRAYAQWDLSITGFIIDGYAPGLNEDSMRAYTQFSPDGIVAQKIEPQGVFEGMPFIRMNQDLDGRPEDVARRIASRFEGEAPQFLIFRTQAFCDDSI